MGLPVYRIITHLRGEATLLQCHAVESLTHLATKDHPLGRLQEQLAGDSQILVDGQVLIHAADLCQRIDWQTHAQYLLSLLDRHFSRTRMAN